MIRCDQSDLNRVDTKLELHQFADESRALLDRHLRFSRLVLRRLALGHQLSRDGFGRKGFIA